MKNNLTKRNFRHMIFLLLPVIAGIAIAFQTAISGQQTARIGAIETAIFIHFFGLLVAVLVYLLQGNTSFSFVSKANLMLVIGGAIGVIIVFSISRSFVENGALTTVMISVLIQLIVSKLIDHFGLFGVDKNPITFTQVLAILLMLSGVILFQYKK